MSRLSFTTFCMDPAAEYGIPEREALERFYTSGVGAAFGDDGCGLYGDSALHIFALFCEEQEEKARRKEAER